MSSEHEVINASGRQPRRRDCRWQPFVNRSGFRVPAFGVMMIRQQEPNGTYTHARADADGQLIVPTYRPDDEAVARQDPYMLCCNSEIPVAPDGRGEMTQDYPAFALHGRPSTLPFTLRPGDPCGPVAGSFYLDAIGGGAFVAQYHPLPFVFQTVRSGPHAISVAPRVNHNPEHYTAAASVVNGGGTAGPGLDPTGFSAVDPLNKVPLPATLIAAQGYYRPDQYSIAAQADAVAFVSFSATVASTAASEGYPLRLSVVDNVLPGSSNPGSDLAVTTYIQAWRKQGLNTRRLDNAGYAWDVDFYTAENLACSGPWVFIKNRVLYLRNDSAHTIMVANAILTVHAIGPYISPAGGTEG